MIFLEKKVMERVEQIIEISSKLEKIEQFCKFIEDVNKIAKCKRSDCPIGPYSDKLKVVFDHMLDCNVHRIFFIEFSIEFSEIFSAMFRLQKKGKENVKGIVDSFEAEAKRKQKKRADKDYLLRILLTQKQEIENFYLFQQTNSSLEE